MFVSFATEQPTAQDSTTEGDSSYCVDFGKGKGPVAFTFDKDQYVAILKEEISNLEVLETRCIRNDNFDPNEPTLGAKFPHSLPVPERVPSLPSQPPKNIIIITIRFENQN